MSFDIGGGATGGRNPGVSRIAIQPDGKLLVSGMFTRFNATPRTSIVRLHPNGTIDDAFNPVLLGINPNLQGPNGELFPPYIHRLVLAPQGQIVISGGFTNVNGNPVTGFARLNSDGTTDTTFKPAAFWYGLLAVQLDGGLIVNGPDGLARLHPDGTPDRDFNPHRGGWSDYGYAEAAVAQSDGSLILAGSFWHRDGTAPVGLLRFLPTPVIRRTWIDANRRFSLGIGGQSGWNYRLEKSSDLRTWNLLEQIPSAGALTEFIDPESATDGARFYRVALPPTLR